MRGVALGTGTFSVDEICVAGAPSPLGPPPLGAPKGEGRENMECDGFALDCKYVAFLSGTFCLLGISLSLFLLSLVSLSLPVSSCLSVSPFLSLRLSLSLVSLPGWFCFFLFLAVSLCVSFGVSFNLFPPVSLPAALPALRSPPRQRGDKSQESAAPSRFSCGGGTVSQTLNPKP